MNIVAIIMLSAGSLIAIITCLKYFKSRRSEKQYAHELAASIENQEAKLFDLIYKETELSTELNEIQPKKDKPQASEGDI